MLHILNTETSNHKLIMIKDNKITRIGNKLKLKKKWLIIINNLKMNKIKVNKKDLKVQKDSYNRRRLTSCNLNKIF